VQAPIAVLFAISACDGGGGSSSTGPTKVDVREELKPVIEALFLGSGPYIPRDGQTACPNQGVMSGFRRGTAVRVIVSTTVSADKQAAIRDTVGQVAMATNGAITASFELTPDPNPQPGRNQVTSTAHPSPTSQGCPSDVGCTQHTGLPFTASRAVQPPSQTPNAFSHDVVGHGVLGLCHIGAHGIGGASQSLMTGGPGVFSGAIARTLSPLDIEAIQAVYSSGLGAGATRPTFVATGLLNP
jgi:hypothetical protein